MSSKTGLVKLSSSTTSSCRTGTDGKLSLYVLRNGAALIGFGLIYGFVIPYTPFPRLALTAHIQFAVEGTMVVAAGLLLQSDPLSSRSINDKASTELVPLADRLNNWQRRVVIIGIASVWATLLTEAANAWWGTRWILVIAHQAAGLVGKESASQWMEWAILATHFPLVLLPLVAMAMGRNPPSSRANITIRTSRPGKINSFKEQFGEGVEVVEIIDIATGDLTNALQGVEIVIHAAAPHIGETDVTRVISGTVDGTLNIARQAAKANVKRIIFTSSWSACVDMGNPAVCFSNYVFTEKDWNPATTEQVLSGKHNKNPVWLHGAAKSLAEQEIWKFADEHPEVDVTTIDPPFIYGPLARGTEFKKEVLRTHSSLGRFYSLLLAGSSLLELPPSLAIPIAVDVRDVARAHILALTAPPATEVGRKRILIGGRDFRMCDVSEHVAATRPELKYRLGNPRVERVTPIATIDTSRAKEILGYNEPLPWKKTVNDMIHSILEVEKSW